MIGFVFGNIFYLYALKNNLSKVLQTAKYTKQLSKLFSTSSNILLVCHINPDGDAIGSQLALHHYILSIGRNSEMIVPNNLQEFLKWMDGSEKINVFIRNRKKCIHLIENADLIVMVDFNQPSRLGEAESYIVASGARKILIDHHLDPMNFADIMITDSSKCSTAEIIYDLVTEMNEGEFSNRSYSEALYVGIITDTGNFEHGSYTSRTMNIVASLLESGIDKGKILNSIYNNFTVDRMKLQGFALNQRMVILPEFRTAYIYLTRADLAEYNHTKGDTEGFVNLPLSIKDIVFSTLFIEKEGFIKLSFRSKGTFPSNEFASQYFSGGGHLNASGGEYPDTLENTIKYFLKVLRENFERFNNSADI
jgi:bifunctional oligoribonuclease and PAP phosphatase NrnA